MENIKKNNAKLTSGRGYYETICDLEVLVKDIDAIMGEGYAAEHPDFLGSIVMSSTIRNAGCEISDSITSLYGSLDRLIMIHIEKDEKHETTDRLWSIIEKLTEK